MIYCAYWHAAPSPCAVYGEKLLSIAAEAVAGVDVRYVKALVRKK